MEERFFGGSFFFTALPAETFGLLEDRAAALEGGNASFYACHSSGLGVWEIAIFDNFTKSKFFGFFVCHLS